MRSEDPLRDLQTSLDELVGTDAVGLPDEQVHKALPALLTAFNQLAAVIASVVASFDVRSLSEVDGCKTTQAWLVAYGRMSYPAAKGWLTRARVLRDLPVLAAAAGRGEVSSEHVAKVADLVHRLDVVTVREFDETLADLAATARPADLANACERIVAHKDPDGRPPDPERDHERREFTISRSGSMFALRGRLDLEGGASLLTALVALMKPPPPTDLRTPTQRRADALVELARLASTSGGLPTVGGVRPSLGILISPESLLAMRASASQPGGPSATGGSVSTTASELIDAEPGPPAGPPGPRPIPATGSPPNPGGDKLTILGIPERPEPGWLTWAGEIPRELAQRLACDSDIWRVVLDPATGLPLEVGRAHRLVPHWIRKALHTRDRGCRWPGCDAPMSWTDAHHLIAWYLGGRTDIGQLVSLCRWHHVRVHEGQWTIRLDPSTGEVHVTRPDGSPYDLGPSLPHTSARRRAA